MTTIAFVIILLECFNGLNVCHAGLRFSAPGFQETSAGTERRAQAADWGKEKEHYKLVADSRYSSHIVFGGAYPLPCNKRGISFCF